MIKREEESDYLVFTVSSVSLLPRGLHFFIFIAHIGGVLLILFDPSVSLLLSVNPKPYQGVLAMLSWVEHYQRIVILWPRILSSDQPVPAPTG